MHHSEKGRSLTQDFEHSLDGQEAASSNSMARWTKKKERDKRNRPEEEDQQSAEWASHTSHQIQQHRAVQSSLTAFLPDAGMLRPEQGQPARQHCQKPLLARPHLTASAEMQPFKSSLLYLLPARWQSASSQANIC